MTKSALPLQQNASFSLSDGITVARETTLATGVPVSLISPDGEVIYPVRLREYPCWLCHIASGSVPDRNGLAGDHAERARIVQHTGGAHIFLCRSNLMHWVSPITVAGRLQGALVGGPVRFARGESDVETDLLAPLRKKSEVVARAQEESLRRMYRRIPLIEADRIEALAQQLHRLCQSISVAETGISGVAEPVHSRLQRESRINEYIQQLKEYRQGQGMQAGIPTYPLETEQRLLQAIRSGDEELAQAILNELLGHVFFTLGADLERIKVRAREIVILLSRIVIARGADADRVFGYNYRALDELDGLDDINDVAHWMARIVRGFAGSVLRIPSTAVHTTALRKVLDYIDQTFRGRVTLEAAAGLAGISTGHLSRLFRREMGVTFSGYVRRVRVKHARELLVGTDLTLSDVAELCGFCDQSHLTLAFRRETATTPAEFRLRR